MDSRDFSSNFVINFILGIDPVTYYTICAEIVLRYVITVLRYLYSNIHDILHSFPYIYFSDVINDVNVWWIACSASEQVKT